MNNFLTTENVNLIWDLISDEQLLSNQEFGAHIYTIFRSNLNDFFKNERGKSNSLMELNKKYITIILEIIKKEKTLLSNTQNNKFITTQQIQHNNLSQFESQLKNHESDFNSINNPEKPPVPKFQIEIDEEPLKETDKLIEEMIKSRNYDIDQISKQQSVPQNRISSKNNFKNDNKTINYISINEPIDDKEIKSDIIDLSRKQISWKDEKEIPNLFDKLKKKTIISNEKNETNDNQFIIPTNQTFDHSDLEKVKFDIKSLEIKIDKIDEKIENIFNFFLHL